MKLLRLILVLLLCAVLPLSGLAASGMAGDCPMQMTAMAGDISDVGNAADTMAVTAMPASMDHCDGMPMPTGGKVKGALCKVAAQCNLGSLYHPAILPEVARATGVERKTEFPYTDALRSRAPDGLWRPPTSL